MATTWKAMAGTAVLALGFLGSCGGDDNGPDFRTASEVSPRTGPSREVTHGWQ